MQYKNWQLFCGANMFFDLNTDSPFGKVFNDVDVYDSELSNSTLSKQIGPLVMFCICASKNTSSVSAL